MQMPPQSPALRRPFARPYSVFLMDFAQYMQPAPAEVAGVTARQVEAFRQSIASDEARILSCVRTGEADPLLDRDPDVIASVWAPYMAMSDDA
jgi:hypothetical protein